MNVSSHEYEIPLRCLESAVGYVHGLGLAYNDINPHNIMIKDGMPLQSLGTESWYEEIFFIYDQKHDIYALKRLREWLQNPFHEEEKCRNGGIEEIKG